MDLASSSSELLYENFLKPVTGRAIELHTEGILPRQTLSSSPAMVLRCHQKVLRAFITRERHPTILLGAPSENKQESDSDCITQCLYLLFNSGSTRSYLHAIASLKKICKAEKSGCGPGIALSHKCEAPRSEDASRRVGYSAHPLLR